LNDALKCGRKENVAIIVFEEPAASLIRKSGVLRGKGEVARDFRCTFAVRGKKMEKNSFGV